MKRFIHDLLQQEEFTKIEAIIASINLSTWEDVLRVFELAEEAYQLGYRQGVEETEAVFIGSPEDNK